MIHTELEVYKKSICFVTDIYQVTSDFPKEEIYGIISQIRRAAVSIPSNIAEGAGRNSSKEFIQFLYIATGSAAEIETQLLISRNLKYINDDIFKELNVVLFDIIKLLKSLIRSIKQKL